MEDAADLLLSRPLKLDPNVTRFSGRLVAASDDTLQVEMSRGSDPIQVPVTSILQLDVHRRTAKRIVRPTLIGAGAGAMVLVLLPDPCLGPCAPRTADEQVEVAVLGAFLGAVFGATYGTINIVVDPWQRVRLPVTTGILPAPDSRFALTATVPL